MTLPISVPLGGVNFNAPGGIGLQGYNAAVQSSMLQPTMQAQLLSQQLQNAMSQANLPYRNMLAQANAMQAYGKGQLAQFQGNNPGITLPGAAGAMMAAQWAQNHMQSQMQPAGQPNNAAAIGAGLNAPSQGQSAPAPQGNGTINPPGTSGLPLSGNAIQKLQQLYPQQNQITSIGQPQPGGSGSAPNNGGMPGISNLTNLAMAPYQKQWADSQLAQRKVAGFDWLNEGKNQQSEDVAQLVGAGIPAQQAVHLLTNGLTVPQIMSQTQFGTDSSKWPTPNFGQNDTSINNIKNNQAAQSFLNKVEPFVTDGLGQYAPYVGKMSPIQIKNALQGMDPESQARFLASIGLQTDIATKRIQLGGGHLGKGALEEMQEQTMQNLVNFVPPNSSVYKRAQFLISQQLNAGSDAYNSALQQGKVTVPFSAQNYPSGSQPLTAQNSGATKLIQVNGKRYRATQAQINSIPKNVQWQVIQ